MTPKKEENSDIPTTQNPSDQTSAAPTPQVQTVGNSTNIAWHNSSITRQDIQDKNKHKSTILWFTGLSGSGKSTLANAVNERLFRARGASSYVLDGDNIRHGLCQDLGFGPQDRQENIRRIGHVAKLFMDAGLIVLTAFVSPFRSDRDAVRALVTYGGGRPKETNFIEVFCNASIEVCETRDTKGLYAKARAGTIPEFTGISSPYEDPVKPEIIVSTGKQTLEDCVDQIMTYLEKGGIIPKI